MAHATARLEAVRIATTTQVRAGVEGERPESSATPSRPRWATYAASAWRPKSKQGAMTRLPVSWRPTTSHAPSESVSGKISPSAPTAE